MLKQGIFFMLGAFTSVVPILLSVEIARTPERWNAPFAHGVCIFAWVFIVGTTCIVMAYGHVELPKDNYQERKPLTCP